MPQPLLLLIRCVTGKRGQMRVNLGLAPGTRGNQTRIPAKVIKHRNVIVASSEKLISKCVAVYPGSSERRCVYQHILEITLEISRD